MASHINPELDDEARQFYTSTMELLNESGVPYLLGGAYALGHYTGLQRHTRDLDLFVREADCKRILDILGESGYKTEMTFPHWLGKAYSGDLYIDLIFSSGNAIAYVDDKWFEYSASAQVFGVDVKLCPAEEIIWSKSFIMERERYDGADIAHLLRAKADSLDWDRLLMRFDKHWRVLLTHLILFGFIYPEEQHKIPGMVLANLLDRVHAEIGVEQKTPLHLCQGTLLSREQYLSDLANGEYTDARLQPYGNMSRGQLAHWTAAIAEKK
jgi:hypothetical protein